MLCAPAPLTQSEEALAPVECEAGWAAEPVQAFWRSGKSVVLTGNRTTFFSRPCRHVVTVATEYPACHSNWTHLILLSNRSEQQFLDTSVK